MDNITKDQIIKAINEIDLNPSARVGRASSTYDLIFNGKFYPPKLVVGIANRFANGTELKPNEFEGGENTKTFELLKKHGFVVNKKNELMSNAIEEQNEFLKEWPIERVEKMTIEEYTNGDRETSFVYWLEKRTENTGSIWGGSAYKFGIYKRLDTSKTVTADNRKTDGAYAWFSKYGTTKDEAFAEIKNIVLQIIKYSRGKEFSKIDNLDLGDAVKWKIAFLYNTENLLPIFKKEILNLAALKLGYKEKPSTKISDLQLFLMECKPLHQSTYEFAKPLWNNVNSEYFYSNIERFIIQANTDNLKKKGYPSTYNQLEVKVSFGVGVSARIPWIAFLKPPNKVTDGIYPVYLYFKAENTLILSYGLSETDTPKFSWPNVEKTETIKNWFEKNKKSEPERYGSSYVMAAYDLNEELEAERIQEDLNKILNEYSQIDFGDLNIATESNNEFKTKRYWLIAPGEDASFWEEFYQKGIIGIGWDKVGNLSKFSTRDQIKNELLRLYPEGSKSQNNNSLCLWQFSNEMKPGDIVITKRGVSEYVGYGIVTGDYYRDDTRSEKKNLRTVEWKKKGIWEETVHSIVLKTMTDITKYPEYVNRLKRLIGIEQLATVDSNKIEYYWLNANPKFWKIEDYQVGDEQSYTTHNETGNKRSRFEYFQRIKIGDLVLGYETSPTKKVLAIFEVTKGAHIDDDDGKEKISFIIQKFLPTPVSYDTLKSMHELENSEVMRNNQGSLFKLTKEEFHSILNKDLSIEIDLNDYSMEDAEKDIFLSKEQLENIIDSLEYKKNIILQGPPGVGKTYMAKRLAYLMMEVRDYTKIEMIQFHQSYSYEDFIQGFKPKEDGGFKLENGVFFRFCKRAQSDPENKYFFIIDEINRGNLSKIFGELMLLIEADKRGQENAVALTYSSSSENRFYIPNNVYLIGTMNTADRSLAVVDYALRRRFAFINIIPSYNEKFKKELLNLGVDEGIIDQIIIKITALNNEISKDPNLGLGFNVGHSYFCNVPKGSGDIDWYNGIIRHELAPLLEEYWFDSYDKSRSEIERLLIV